VKDAFDSDLMVIGIVMPAAKALPDMLLTDTTLSGIPDVSSKV
jgi:hypothetical protein